MPPGSNDPSFSSTREFTYTLHLPALRCSPRRRHPLVTLTRGCECLLKAMANARGTLDVLDWNECCIPVSKKECGNECILPKRWVKREARVNCKRCVG